MKTMFLTLAALTIGNFSLADSWPYDPACTRYFAISETVLTDSNPPEKIVLCKFDLDSYVDKNSLGTSIQTWAVQSYQRNSRPMRLPCTNFGAFAVQARDSNGFDYRICRFQDRSYMEYETFLRGPGSAFNYEMDQALSSTLF